MLALKIQHVSDQGMLCNGYAGGFQGASNKGNELEIAFKYSVHVHPQAPGRPLHPTCVEMRQVAISPRLKIFYREGE